MFKSWLPFEWIVSLRFLREGRLQTLFIISGIAVGGGVIVFVSAVLAGLPGGTAVLAELYYGVFLVIFDHLSKTFWGCVANGFKYFKRVVIT